MSELREVSPADTPRLREWGANEFPHFHSPVDTEMQMPCHPKFSLDKRRSARKGARSCCCSPRWKIHTPLLPRHHSESKEFKNMNQLQGKTQLSGRNACILIDVQWKVMLHTHSLVHVCTHRIGQTNKSCPRLPSFRRLWKLWQAWVNMLFLLIHKD